jgi:hypothetical protein
MKKAKIVSLSLILLFFVLSTVASASEMWPGWFKKNRTHGTATTGGTTVTGNGTVSVAEPAAIMLLGAGLVSLGLYAKRKRGKKQ